MAKIDLSDLHLKPGQIFTLRGEVYQVRKANGVFPCRLCDANESIRTLVGSKYVYTNKCMGGFPYCSINLYFKKLSK